MFCPPLRAESLLSLRLLGLGCLALGCLGLIAGCESKTKAPPKGPYVSFEASNWTTPTEEEAMAFANEFSDVLNQLNIRAINNLIDWNAIIERSIGAFDGVPRSSAGFKGGVTSSLNSPSGMAGQWVANIEAGGDVSFLRVRGSEKNRRALFRLLMPEDGGINYFDLVLAKKPDGSVAVIDIYVFLSSELISETLRRSFAPLAAEESKSVLAKLTRTENDMMKHIDKFLEIVQSVQSGNHQRAIDVYYTLPESLQGDKNILLMRVKAAMQLNEKEYVEALEAFRKYHPKDPCIDLMSIDHHLLTENYEEVFNSVDRLDQLVGGDPYLNVIRSNVEIARKHYDEAIAFANQAVEDDEMFLNAYWCLITISLEQEKYEQTAMYLDEVLDNFQLEMYDLNEVPEYAGFVKSPAYRSWLARQEK